MCVLLFVVVSRRLFTVPLLHFYNLPQMVLNAMAGLGSWYVDRTKAQYLDNLSTFARHLCLAIMYHFFLFKNVFAFFVIGCLSHSFSCRLFTFDIVRVSFFPFLQHISCQ